MTQLFKRDITVQVGTWRIASRDEIGVGQPILRIAFSISKSTARDPNKATLRIWNLSESSRAQVQTQERLPVIIEAGYEDGVRQLFSGDMRFAQSVREGPDWVTTLQAGDGSKEYKSARINQSFGPGTQITDVMKSCADSLGLGSGNISKVIAAGSKRLGLTQFLNGTVVSGKSADQLDNIVKSMGLEWSVQDGQVQILESTETTQDTAVFLAPETGLIGSPTAGEKGNIKARSLLQGDIYPGRKIQVNSELIPGAFFRTEKVKHSGDTWGNDWFSDVEASPL